MLLYQRPNLHIYGFRPKHPHGRKSAYGFTVRYRRGRIWTHFVLRLRDKSPPVPGGRGAWTYEALSWKTEAGTGNNRRVTYKQFVRLKIGRGGMKP